jgi:translocation and assembly module TamA
MERRVAVLALACALGAAGCLRVRGTPEEPVVVDLRLEGVRSVDADALKEKLATQASGRWAWNEPSRLDPDALSADQRRIEAYYRERGFYDAHVTGVDEEPVGGDRGRVRIVIKVSEGRPVRVKKLIVNGLDEAPGWGGSRSGKGTSSRWVRTTGPAARSRPRWPTPAGRRRR